MNYINSFFNLFFPRVCEVCGRALFKHENFVCNKCRNDLPRSYFHLVDKNPVELTFWGRVEIRRASSFLLYVKGNKVQTILHSIKYRNNKLLGYELGRTYGRELNETLYFDYIDVVIPVPLHPKKLRIRGYNQSEYIAKGLAETIGAHMINDSLHKVENTKTQTRKGRYERWENVSDVFEVVNALNFKGKNILLVDDVLTTGATLEACARAIDSVGDVSISIATLAYATL